MPTRGAPRPRAQHEHGLGGRDRVRRAVADTDAFFVAGRSDVGAQSLVRRGARLRVGRRVLGAEGADQLQFIDHREASSALFSSSCRRTCWRARLIRDLTVPVGMPAAVAISGYDSPTQ